MRKDSARFRDVDFYTVLPAKGEKGDFLTVGEDVSQGAFSGCVRDANHTVIASSARMILSMIVDWEGRGDGGTK